MLRQLTIALLVTACIGSALGASVKAAHAESQSPALKAQAVPAAAIAKNEVAHLIASHAGCSGSSSRSGLRRLFRGRAGSRLGRLFRGSAGRSLLNKIGGSSSSVVGGHQKVRITPEISTQARGLLKSAGVSYGAFKVVYFSSQVVAGSIYTVGIRRCDHYIVFRLFQGLGADAGVQVKAKEFGRSLRIALRKISLIQESSSVVVGGHVSYRLTRYTRRWGHRLLKRVGQVVSGGHVVYFSRQITAGRFFRIVYQIGSVFKAYGLSRLLHFRLSLNSQGEGSSIEEALGKLSAPPAPQPRPVPVLGGHYVFGLTRYNIRWAFRLARRASLRLSGGRLVYFSRQVVAGTNYRIVYQQGTVFRAWRFFLSIQGAFSISATGTGATLQEALDALDKPQPLVPELTGRRPLPPIELTGRPPVEQSASQSNNSSSSNSSLPELTGRQPVTEPTKIPELTGRPPVEVSVLPPPHPSENEARDLVLKVDAEGYGPHSRVMFWRKQVSLGSTVTVVIRHSKTDYRGYKIFKPVFGVAKLLKRASGTVTNDIVAELDGAQPAPVVPTVPVLGGYVNIPINLLTEVQAKGRLASVGEAFPCLFGRITHYSSQVVNGTNYRIVVTCPGTFTAYLINQAPSISSFLGLFNNGKVTLLKKVSDKNSDKALQQLTQ